MDAVEMSGKTVAEAVRKALEQMGLTEDQVTVTVVKKGRSGILGLGGEDALVRVEPVAAPQAPEAPEAAGSSAEVAQEVANRLLSLLGVSAKAVVSRVGEGEEERLVLNIEGDDLGILIGRRGQTLASLQYVVRLIVAKRMGTRQSLAVDIEGYKERRYRSLQALAVRMAEQVKGTGRGVSLEPMPADERRVVHLALAEDPEVTTESEGEGEDRRIVITMKR